jgi:hypothetical protein
MVTQLSRAIIKLVRQENLQLKPLRCQGNKPRLYPLFRFVMAAYIVKCTATRYRIYKDRVEYINIIQLL